MILILCDPQDVSALWAHDHLRQRLGADVQLVTPGLLAAALSWEHRLTNTDTDVRIELTDGRVITRDSIAGVLNRLLEAPVSHWQASDEADRLYVQQEMTAFYLSWLHSLDCPVYNRATPQGLCGQWRHESQWAALAGEAGLPVAEYVYSTRDLDTEDPLLSRKLRPKGVSVHTAIVVEDTVCGLHLPPETADACRRLGRLSGTALLGIDFVLTPARTLTFAGASPLPDLRLGGRPLIDALARSLGAGVPSGSPAMLSFSLSA